MDDEDEYAFATIEGTINSFEDGTVNICVGDVRANHVLIDYVASCNIIDKELWGQLKNKRLNAHQQG